MSPLKQVDHHQQEEQSQQDSHAQRDDLEAIEQEQKESPELMTPLVHDDEDYV